MFRSSGEMSYREWTERKNQSTDKLVFGIDYLDHSLCGILHDDLILIGAPSGMGKTQLCCTIATANIKRGKRVHYIALEASEWEIEHRLKFPMILESFLKDQTRPRLEKKLTYSDWLMGEHKEILEKYEAAVAPQFAFEYENLFVKYKTDEFNVDDLIATVLSCSNETDLIIIDHVHYFDFDDDNENRAIKKIAKTVRTLALEEMKPIILVAHLRKRDKQNEELVPGLDEFHGSSDLYKIATRVVTFSPGPMTSEGNYITYFRTPKNRLDGGSTRFIGLEYFSPKRGTYEPGRYKLGWSGASRKDGFKEIERSFRPSWARPETGPS